MSSTTQAEERSASVYVRHTQADDIEQIRQLCLRVYTFCPPWGRREISRHLQIFPDGQFVAVYEPTGQIVGMAASLIIMWEDYEINDNWEDFTSGGTFETHDPYGRTLYGADVMVDPEWQGYGIGKKIYAARRELVRRLGLLRIRAGSRLRGYGAVAQQMAPREYVMKVVSGELGDATLSFQLKQGFNVLAVAAGYLPGDPESLGYAAVIEWLNPEIATEADYAAQQRAWQRLVGWEAAEDV